MSRTQTELADADTRYSLSTLEAHVVIFKGHQGALLRNTALEKRHGRLEGGEGVSEVGKGKEFSRQKHFPGTARKPV